MFNLFNEDESSYAGDINIAILDLVKRNLTRELKRVVNYYRENVHAVHSNHFLTKIMNQLPVSLQDNLDYYYLKTLDRAEDISMSLKLTSPIYRGKVFDGMIYGPSSKEIYICVNDDIDNYRHSHWRDLEPLRIISHPRTSLMINPLKNVDFENEIGVVVFLLDIPKLMIQYRKWTMDPLAFNRELSDRSMMQFIAMQVLPNILFSHLDIAIFNRLVGYRFDETPTKDYPRFPIATINYTNQLDPVLLELNRKLNKHKKTFTMLLKNIPAISHQDYLDAIKIPPMAVTRNNKWALTLARLQTVRYLFKHIHDTDNDRNMTARNSILRHLREMKNDRTIENMLPPEMFNDYLNVINNDIIGLAYNK